MRYFQKTSTYLLTFLLSFTTLTSLFAQKSTQNDPAFLYKKAREAAFRGNHDSASMMCQQILAVHPEYDDARVLMARTFGWDNQFDSARLLLNKVISREYDHYDALLALADVELWARNFKQASRYVYAGLSFFPDDSEFLKRKQLIQERKYAKDTTLIPGKDSVALKGVTNPLDISSCNNSLLFDYYFDYFKVPYFHRWHMISVGYGHLTSSGKLIGRLNTGQDVNDGEHLFSDPSVQAELDFYPRLTINSYLYLNYGYGIGSFFPMHRAGLEYFRGLPKGFEVSIGLRYMKWDHHFLFATGSVSKYVGLNYISFRPYIAIAGKAASNSYLLTYRRYLVLPDNYVFIMLGTGDSPDQPYNLVDDYGKYKSTRLRTGWQIRFEKILWHFSVGYQYEEYRDFISARNAYRNRYDLNLGLEYCF